MMHCKVAAASDPHAVPTYAELCARTDAPPGSSWGLFGKGDEIGALNFLTAHCVLAAARCVTRGAVFTLDYPINHFDPDPAPGRPPATHSVYWIGITEDGEFGPLPGPQDADPKFGESSFMDDRLDGYTIQRHSHIDGLRHVRNNRHGFYGGARDERMLAGDPTIGVNRWADRGIVGRGVLADVARHRERLGRPLDHAAGEQIGVALLEETLAAQGTTLEPGDMLLVRTDFPRYFWSNPGTLLPNAGLAQHREVVAWLWDRRIPLVAADNLAVEAYGTAHSVEDEPLDSLHNVLIPLLGMVLGELWRLDALSEDCAADNRYEFMLVLKPLNLVGGVASPPNATAIK
jgi:hypothetical protein